MEGREEDRERGDQVGEDGGAEGRESGRKLGADSEVHPVAPSQPSLTLAPLLAGHSGSSLAAHSARWSGTGCSIEGSTVG